MEHVSVVLQQVASLTQPSSHMLQVYVCEGGGEGGEEEVEAEAAGGTASHAELLACSLAPFVWDSLLVQCDPAPSRQAS